jgi:hypothetical protein
MYDVSIWNSSYGGWSILTFRKIIHHTSIVSFRKTGDPYYVAKRSYTLHRTASRRIPCGRCLVPRGRANIVTCSSPVNLWVYICKYSGNCDRIAIAFVNEFSLQWQSQKQLLPQFVKATRIQLRIQLRLRIQLINVLVHNITIRFDILSLHIPTSHR